MTSYNQDSKVLKFIQGIVNPAKPPANVVFLVLLRVITLILLFLSMTVLILSILVRPWKSEVYKGAYMEIGLWTICRFDTVDIDLRCFNDFYKENDGGAWFHSWRYLMVASIVLKAIAFIYICIELVRLKNKDRKPWVAVSFISLLAGIATFCSLILFYMKFEFEFVEDGFRTEIMGWTEETGDKEDFQEIIGIPYIMCWCSVIGILLTSYVSYYSKCEEDIFIKELMSNKNNKIYKNGNMP